MRRHDSGTAFPPLQGEGGEQSSLGWGSLPLKPPSYPTRPLASLAATLPGKRGGIRKNRELPWPPNFGYTRLAFPVGVKRP